MPVSSNSAATPPACKSRSPVRTASLLLMRALREIFEVRMQAEYFPVQLDHMGANFEFLQIADASKHFTGINNVATVVTAQRHNHPGGAYSFRIERNGKVLVICTDGEQIDPRLVELARGADLLVHDAQYTAEELQKRRGLGHSSFDQAMQLAEMAGVKRLAMTHHDPGPRRRVSSAHRKIVPGTVPRRGACPPGNGNRNLAANFRKAQLIA